MSKLFCTCISLFIFICANAQTVSGGKSLCGGSADLTVTPAGDSYQWQYSSSGTNPWSNAGGTCTNQNYTATAEGYYRVIVTSGGSAKTSASYFVADSPKPDASFSFTPNGECSSTPVSFTNVNTPGATLCLKFR